MQKLSTGWMIKYFKAESVFENLLTFSLTQRHHLVGLTRQDGKDWIGEATRNEIKEMVYTRKVRMVIKIFRI